MPRTLDYATQRGGGSGYTILASSELWSSSSVIPVSSCSSSSSSSYCSGVLEQRDASAIGILIYHSPLAELKEKEYEGTVCDKIKRHARKGRKTGQKLKWS